MWLIASSRFKAFSSQSDHSFHLLRFCERIESRLWITETATRFQASILRNRDIHVQTDRINRQKRFVHTGFCSKS